MCGVESRLKQLQQFKCELVAFVLYLAEQRIVTFAPFQRFQVATLLVIADTFKKDIVTAQHLSCRRCTADMNNSV